MTELSLALVVLRTSDMEASRTFYEALGLSLTPEKHGSGPIHYSCELGRTVLEIYPGEVQEAIDHRKSGATMFGFEVASLDATLSALEQTGAHILTSPRTTVWGRRAVVQDPDGRAIEINEPPKS